MTGRADRQRTPRTLARGRGALPAAGQGHAGQRLARSAAADSRLRSLWDSVAAELDLPDTGAALAAVGGYGRSQLSPASDLDVVLLVDDGYDQRLVPPVAEHLWYPLWDANVPIDHSVRTVGELRLTAAEDLRVALGALDLRHVAGDPTLTLAARAVLLADWRRAAKRRLPELAAASRDRWRQRGDLAHAATPDLKESHGGLRDVTVLRALLASWLVDVPAAELDRLERELLTVRDALHASTGRRSDRLVADDADEVAHRLQLPGRESLASRVAATGRGVAHLATVGLRTVDWLFAPRSAGARRTPRPPRLERLAPGVAEHRGEVVLTKDADPSSDPLLALRAAAAATEHGLVLTDVAAARLGRESAPMPVPWPAEARATLTRVLGAGPPLVDVWEALDQYGVVDRWLPEWARVRYLAPRSPLHRYTVDRHLVQTCVEAADVATGLERPDLLLLAALLHDLGKGGEIDHCELGEVLAWDAASRLGYGARDVSVVAGLVRHHLLLIKVATQQDLDDPAVVDQVATAVGDPLTLRLLAALTEADARATGAQAWSPWRAQLVRAATDRVLARLVAQH